MLLVKCQECFEKKGQIALAIWGSVACVGVTDKVQPEKLKHEHDVPMIMSKYYDHLGDFKG